MATDTPVTYKKGDAIKVWRRGEGVWQKATYKKKEDIKTGVLFHCELDDGTLKRFRPAFVKMAPAKKVKPAAEVAA